MLGISMLLNLPDSGPDFHSLVLEAVGYPESYGGTERWQDVLDHCYSALRQRRARLGSHVCMWKTSMLGNIPCGKDGFAV